MSGKPQYISASRRTDLPRFHTEHFFQAVRKGEITYDGGYGRAYTVSLRPEDVLGYIFWSKDFSSFIAHPEFRPLIRSNNTVFHFTINNCPELEPFVPSIRTRLDTLRILCDEVGAERVLWRFDPVCQFIDSSGECRRNDLPFYELLKEVASIGIKRCYFSFLTGYRKLAGRSIAFRPLKEHQRIAIAGDMLKAASSESVGLFNCCNEEIPQAVPGIQTAGCVDESVLAATDRFGVHRVLKAKPTRTGCGCYESRDIGSYSDPCPHGCLYCYGNPLISR